MSSETVGDDAELADARNATIEAAVACLKAANLGSLEDRRLGRQFDPTWAALHVHVKAYVVALRSHGRTIDEAIGELKSAILMADPTLPPHNALRATAVGWCVAAYFADRKTAL